VNVPVQIICAGTFFILIPASVFNGILVAPACREAGRNHFIGIATIELQVVNLSS